MSVQRMYAIFVKDLSKKLFTALALVVCIVLGGYQPAHVGIVIVALLVSIGFYLVLDTLLGLLTTLVIQASIALLPAMFIFGFSLIIEEIVSRYPVTSVLEYMPNVQLVELARQVEQGAAWGGATVPLLWIAGWAVAMWVIVGITYQQCPGVLKPASIGVKTALIYGMLFVILMLISGKTITADNLGLPAAALFLANNDGDYMERKSHNHFRQVIVAGSFLSAAVCSILMAFWAV